MKLQQLTYKSLCKILKYDNFEQLTHDIRVVDFKGTLLDLFNLTCLSDYYKIRVAENYKFTSNAELNNRIKARIIIKLMGTSVIVNLPYCSHNLIDLFEKLVFHNYSPKKLQDAINSASWRPYGGQFSNIVTSNINEIGKKYVKAIDFWYYHNYNHNSYMKGCPSHYKCKEFFEIICDSIKLEMQREE